MHLRSVFIALVLALITTPTSQPREHDLAFSGVAASAPSVSCNCALATAAPKAVAAGGADPAASDPLSIGTGLTPGRNVAAVERSQSQVQPLTELQGTPAAVPLLSSFATDGIYPVLNSRAPAPYQLVRPVTKARPVPSSSDGVPLRLIAGRAFDHPSNQAVWGLQQLESYRLTKDPFYLGRAKAAAQHLVSTSVASRNALWFPYPFDFVIAGDTSARMAAPWYSAMAQGEALSLFVRLWAVSGDPRWRSAADHTLTSLSLLPEAGKPWVTHVDSAGFLWLEEYPREPVERSERVLNGSIFAVYGLHDYWRLVTQSTESRQLAARLFDAGATTVRRYAMSAFRAPAWISRYSLLHVIRSPYYHQVHVQQLLQLQYLTGRPEFARAADTFRTDYPSDRQPGSIAFSVGTHAAYRFDSGGHVVAAMSRRLVAPSSAPNDVRRRIRGHGIYYHMTRGAFAGWWVRESWPLTYQRSVRLRHNYFPDRHVSLRAGTWTAYRYDSFGRVVDRRSARYTLPTGAPASASAVIHGQLHLLMSRGRYAGFWLPVITGVSLT